MRGHKLTILAVVSLVALPVLLSGYFGTNVLSILHVMGDRWNTCDWQFAVGVERGRCALEWLDRRTSVQPGPGRFKIQPYIRLGLPKLRTALWGFELIFQPDHFLVLVPIWCLALPCTIAPMLWLRRRRRRSSPRGFAVETTVASEALK